MTQVLRPRIVVCSCAGSPFCAEALEHLRRTEPDLLNTIVGLVLSRPRRGTVKRTGGGNLCGGRPRIRWYDALEWRLNKLRFETGVRLRAARARVGKVEWRAPEDFCRDRLVDWHETRDVNGTECIEWMQSKAPDLIVIMTFHHILKRRAIEVPAIAAVNVHPSLLPAYRGAAPIEQALRDRVAETGVTLHYVDEGIDTGPIIAQAKQAVGAARTEKELRPQLARRGAELLIEYLRSLEARR